MGVYAGGALAGELVREDVLEVDGGGAALEGELVGEDVLGDTGVSWVGLAVVWGADGDESLWLTVLLKMAVVKLRSGVLMVVEGMATEVKKV